MSVTLNKGRPEGRPCVAARGEDLSGFPHHRNPFAREDLRGTVGVFLLHELRQVEPSRFAPWRSALARLVNRRPASTTLSTDNVCGVHLLPPYVGNPDVKKLTTFASQEKDGQT